MKVRKFFFYFSSSAILKELYLYLLYYLMIWVICLILMSIIAFFHFLLDHGLSVIEDWIFDNGHQLVLLTKLSAFFLIYKILSVRNPYRSSVKNFLFLPGRAFTQGSAGRYHSHVCLYCLFGKTYFIPPLDVSWFKIFISYFSLFIFYMSDFLLIKFIGEGKVFRPVEKVIGLFLYPLLLWVFSKITFLHEKNIDFFIYFNFFICRFLSEYQEPTGFSRHLSSSLMLPSIGLIWTRSHLGKLLFLDENGKPPEIRVLFGFRSNLFELFTI